MHHHAALLLVTRRHVDLQRLRGCMCRMP
ncbi:putative leader peptide [Luteococcus sediminum]